MNLRTVVFDFFDGGEPNTYYFWPPHQLTERMKQHSALAFLWEWYNHGAQTYCIGNATGRLSQQTRFRHEAPGSQYLDDYLDWWGQQGEGAPYLDLGLNALGSFEVTVRTEIDCSRCWRSLFVQVYNRFDEKSLLRKPWNTDESLDLTFGLAPVDLFITFEQSGRF